MKSIQKGISIILIMIVLLLSSNIFLYDTNAEDISTSSIEVFWTNIYQSFDEMITDCDLVFYGIITQQDVDVYENNLIYTKNTVRVIDHYKGSIVDTVTIYQLGGFINGESTPFPVELSKLPQNEPCIFFCTGTPSESWISGAGQGIFNDVEFEGWESALEKCKNLFYNPYAISPKATPETPTNSYEFPRTTTQVQFAIAGGSSYLNADCLSALKSGLLMWNGCTPMTISEGVLPISGPKVIINITDSYHWQYSTFLGLTLKSDTYQRTIDYYLKAIRDCGYTNNTTIWKKLGLHEMGHAIGLGHNISTSSAMYPTVEGQASSPQYSDILTLKDLYY